MPPEKKAPPATNSEAWFARHDCVALNDDFAEEAGFTRIAQSSVHGKIPRPWTPRNGLLTVFYDGGCPLCLKEIQHYIHLQTNEYTASSLLPESPLRLRQPLQFANVHGEEFVMPPELSSRGIQKLDLLKTIHALDENGSVVTGARVFKQMWERLPYWNAMGLITKVPLVMMVAEKIYTHFASRRFQMRLAMGDVEDAKDAPTCAIARGKIPADS